MCLGLLNVIRGCPFSQSSFANAHYLTQFFVETLSTVDKLAMLKRREFLGCLTALGGSYLLTGCGGGSGSSAGGSIANTTSSNPAAKAMAVANAAVAAASPNNTTIPPSTSIVDTSGAIWTLVNGVVYQNGAVAGVNYNVAMVLYFGNSVYHKTTTGVFFCWMGSFWSLVNDPRLGGTSADGTAIPSSTYIIDKLNNVWTVVGGVVYRNNQTVGTTYNVSLLLWFGGKIWHIGTGVFFVLSGNDTWERCIGDPRTPVPASAGSFYGMNGHFDYSYTPAQIVSMLKAMNCTIYRVGTTSDSSVLYRVIGLAQAFQAAGMTLFVLINEGLTDSSGNLYTSESVAYSASRAAAATIAGYLAPYGVTMYECGNELTRQGTTVVNSTYAGTKASDFNNTNWPIMRGVMRGLIDGVKSIQPSAKCGINFCVADTGASDALWDGMQPDGSSGYPLVRWDITTWHNYEVYGDIFNIGQDGASPGFDLPTYCKARYGVPFIISEWNANLEDSQAFRGTYITSQLGEFYAARKTHNIQSVIYFELDSGNNTWGVVNNGVLLNPPHSALTAFTSANPDS
jgi:hypothetical protein